MCAAKYNLSKLAGRGVFVKEEAAMLGREMINALRARTRRAVQCAHGLKWTSAC